MVSICGYSIQEQLYNGSRTLVYRGVREHDQKPVVIKLLKNPYPGFNELLQFRNQYTIAKNLDIPGIVPAYALESYQNGYALVMEDFGGVSLREYMQTNSASVKDILSILVQVSDILHNVHQKRVIHKDIKPANILINPQTEEIKLIDFSIASLLPFETQEIKNPYSLEGTLAYLSPEQTGRMNRGIDFRADFYALGVTFYELLTGKLPFKSDDAMELVHCHIAQAPKEINSKEIPQILSDIVIKLMAKNAEDRYQSALGLKHDLEICLKQLKDTGKIEYFQIAQRDKSDRFIIPEKLYGRETEVQTLLEAFNRVAGITSVSSCSLAEPSKEGKPELMLVAGFSGIGKTALINEVHKPIVKQRGYFIKGKFDQFNRNIPFSAFVQALRNLMVQLLSENDAQLSSWKHKILQGLGDNAQVIIEVIPELQQIIGQQPPVPELSGNAAQNRFNLLFQKFIQVFTTKDHPLVIFLDDLQWADSVSLKLMQLLMSESQTGYLLIIGAYRDNEVFPAHPLMLMLEEIRKASAVINRITLLPLSAESLNKLVADTLNCSFIIAQPLTRLIYQKTQGNPFFSTQFLKALHEEGLITFDVDSGYWQCDIAKIRETALTDNVVEFMALQLQKSPLSTQNILKLAACIGNQFDLSTLAIISQQSEAEVATALWRGLQSGFILPQSEVYKFYIGQEQQVGPEIVSQVVNYKFLHDRVQQAAYSLIREVDKGATHLKIGRQLWHNLSQSELENHLFTIVNHLNVGCDLISEQWERDRIARLNLQASQKAKASVAYETSRRYCYAGQLFLHSDSWEENYSLRFALAIATIEAEYFNHNLQVAQHLALQTLEKVQTLLDRIKVHELQILFEINQNRMNEAISLALDVLVLVGINLPTESQKIQSEIELLRLEIALPTEEIANLATLKVIQDEEKLAAVRILTNASSAAYIANPTIYPAIVIHTVRYCMKYGNSPLAASAYSWYGALLCGVYDEIEAGYEFGKLSLQLLEKFNARALTAKVSNMFNVFTRPWKEHLKNAIGDIKEAIQSGFENGDVEYAFYAAVHYCNYLFYSGSTLDEVRQAQERYLPEIVKAQYKFHQGFLSINQQVVVNLLGVAENSCLQGLVLDGEDCLSQWLENNIVFLVFCFYEAQTRLAYLFGDNIGAQEAGDLGWQYRQAAMGTLYVSEHNFYYSLALLANGELKEPERVAANQSQLKVWAEFSPSNFKHKYDLVEAERHRILGKKTDAIELYDCAIAGARENGYIHELALANELTAKFYLEWGKQEAAMGYMLQAYYCYAKWGAKAKTDDLEKRYPQLLQPILQQRQLNINRDETIAGITRMVTLESTHTSSTGITSVSDILDFTSVLKAAQAISGCIELDELITNLTKIILENSGAKKSILILPKKNTWEVKAITFISYENKPEGEIQSIISDKLVDTSEYIPRKIINYVKNTLNTVVIDNCQTDIPGLIGEYMLKHQPKSVLCKPIVNQGHLVAVLYLENQITSGVFTLDSLQVINLLSSQAAISLENARLYQQAQQALTDLQQAQLQIVQSEKMSALGNLVAGVAHEMNNPLGFIANTLKQAKPIFTDITEYLKLYQESFPNKSEEILDREEEIDLDYTLEDLPKMIDAMVMASDRLKNISTSLRTFSRADKDYKVSFNIHDGLDSTILILKHRLKANEQRPAIEVVKEYGNLPSIECFPGQLNQVFMNILANAIDALDESNTGRNFDEIKTNPNKITVKTLVENNQVKISIADNGKGMSLYVKQKIFDHLFTTKDVGKGTGLGLAIARQIIVEKHGGSISVDSAPNQGTEFTICLSVNC